MNPPDGGVSRRHRLGVRIVFAFFFLSLVSYIVYESLTVSVRGERFHELVRAAEYKITSGNHADAVPELDAASSFASTRQDWLSLLGLLITVSESTGDHSTFAEVAMRAAKNLPGNEELWAIAAYGLLAAERHAEAYKLAERRLSSARYADLLAEAALRLSSTGSVAERGTDSSGDRTVPDLAETLTALTERTDPGLLEQAGELSGEPRFHLDAAMIRAREGKIDEAYEVFSSRFPPESVTTLPDEFREAGALLAFDTGHTGAALRYLGFQEPTEGSDGPGTPRTLPVEERHLLLAGDIYLDMNAAEPAAAVYRRLLIRNPEYSWIPYMNSAYIERVSGKIREAERLLEAGLSRFKDDSRLTLALARLRYDTGRSEQADALLDAYVSRFPRNHDARLLYLKRSRAPVLPARYEASLWALFSEYPTADETLRYLCWYLLGRNDWTGIRQALGSDSGRTAALPGAVFYRAVYDAVHGEPERAAAGFETAAKLSGSVEARYNLAVLYRELGRKDKAERALLESLETGSVSIEIDASLRSRVLTELAGLYLEAGRYKEAVTAAQSAVEADPRNLEAQMLLRSRGAAP